MKNITTNRTTHEYWLVGNSIDGVCCFPHRKKVNEPELIDYLETNFLLDFNASRGEFDFTIYLDREGFHLRLRYGYYLEGHRSSVIARVDYMTADMIHRVIRRNRIFFYYGPPAAGRGGHVLRIALPERHQRLLSQFKALKKEGNNAKQDAV